MILLMLISTTSVSLKLTLEPKSPSLNDPLFPTLVCGTDPDHNLHLFLSLPPVSETFPLLQDNKHQLPSLPYSHKQLKQTFLPKPASLISLLCFLQVFSAEVAATFADMEREVVNASRGYEVVCCSGLSVDLMINVATDLEIELQVRRGFEERGEGIVNEVGEVWRGGKENGRGGD